MTSMQLAAPGLKCWQCGSPAGRSKDGIGACGRHLLPGRNERKAMLKAAAKPPKASRPATGRTAHSAPARKGPVVNGQQFAPGYTREAAKYEAKTMPDPCQVPEPTHVADPTSTADMCQVPAWTPEQTTAWLDGVTFSKPTSSGGRREVTCRWSGEGPYGVLVLRESHNTGDWNIERLRTQAERNKARSYQARETLTQYQLLPLRTAKIVAARELKGYPMPGTTRVRYSGSEPLRRERWWITNEGDMMASAKARVRSGAALAALQADAEFIIHPEGYAA